MGAVAEVGSEGVVVLLEEGEADDTKEIKGTIVAACIPIYVHSCVYLGFPVCVVIILEVFMMDDTSRLAPRVRFEMWDEIAKLHLGWETDESIPVASPSDPIVLGAQGEREVTLPQDSEARDMQQRPDPGFSGSLAFVSTWGDRSAEFAFSIYLRDICEYAFTRVNVWVHNDIHWYSVFRGRWTSNRYSSTPSDYSNLYCHSKIIRLDVLRTFPHLIHSISTLDSNIRRLFLAFIITCGCGLKLATVGMNVCVERDWVMAIAASARTPHGSRAGSPASEINRGSVSPPTRSVDHADRVLLELNTTLRRIDLISKLVAPLFVSLLTSTIGYMLSAVVLLSMSLATAIFEILFVGITYKRFSDPLIAGMRGLCVITGLFGTFAMPWLEKRIGLIRTGSWAIWSEALSLVPTVVCLFVGIDQRQRPVWNSILLFAGIRNGVFSHWTMVVRSNTIDPTPKGASPSSKAKYTLALQYSLQNIFDLGHYGLTLGWNRPTEFKYAAVVSLGATFVAALVYVVGYARPQRGHLFHFDKLRSQLVLLLPKP
ncbi:Ferroportin1 (FPN1) [Rhizoctonia solani]|uniref:Solute carrier family 40 member n=1 Tax=Rhizoctonia solani TaxID=456999 RepID=A0A8H7I2W3_9AGAM|nr:Ferroportin1 (FPN1) [Rhizoctonia solani]